jgi:hypothetical protein
VANRAKARRGRARKRRPALAPAAAEGDSARRRPAGGDHGGRPRAPWHPLPLSELLILIGAIGIVVSLGRGFSAGAPTLLAGIAAVLIGTLEVTLREHLSGYRSHTLILALLPTIIFHSAVILIVVAFTSAPRILNVALLLPDVLLFTTLFKALRVRFLNAQRERMFRGVR